MKTNSRIFVVCLFLFSFILFYSCYKQKMYTEKERNKVFLEKYSLLPARSLQDMESILAFFRYDENQSRYEFTFLKKNGSGWEEINRFQLDAYRGDEIDSLRIVPLDNRSFLYFEEYVHGGNMGNYGLHFHLYDYHDDQLYSIDYEYFPQGSLSFTSFTKSENMGADVLITDYLEKQAYTSNRIYTVSETEKLALNFIEKNGDAYKKIETNLDEWIRMEPVETDVVLFDITNAQAEYVNFAENEDFIVVSIHTDPIYVYHKPTEKYRIVWTPTSKYEWISHLQFDSNNNLLLYLRGFDQPDYVVNLYKSLYMSLSSDPEDGFGSLLQVEHGTENILVNSIPGKTD